MKPGHRKNSTLLTAAGLVAVSVLFGGCGANFRTAATSAAGQSQPTSLEQPFGLPAQYRMEVPLILQNPELPNGCEATALAMVLQYHGYEVDKIELAYTYIPREDFELVDGRRTGGNPELVYPGDPAGTGYYCLPRVVAGAANRYLSRQQGTNPIARNITGATEAELKTYLSAGAPVLVWKTIDDEPPVTNPYTAWYLSGTGELYEPYSNLHVVVLTGYDEENFYICDPQDLYGSLPIAQFMNNYEQMGSRAVVIA